MHRYSILSRRDKQRFHRILGNYLAVYAWQRGADCVRVSGSYLKFLFGMQRFRGKTFTNLREDIRGWFPHSVPDWNRRYRFPNRQDKSIAQIFFSRVEFPKAKNVDLSLRVIDFRDESEDGFSEMEMVQQLLRFASGIDQPLRASQTMPDLT